MLRITAALIGTIIGVGVAMGAPVEVPKSFLGTWETDPANCGRDDALDGFQMSFIEEDQTQVLLLLSHESEPTYCPIFAVSGSGNSINVDADCTVEDFPAERVQFLLDLDPERQTLQSVEDWDRSTDSQLTFHRCE